MNKLKKVKKRQNLPIQNNGCVYVVATPIGNLEDISKRAQRLFNEVDFILCEDTRRAQQLLNALQLQEKECIRLDQHTELTKLPLILERFRLGQKAVLISDAGTPGVSDPGALFVSEILKAGFPVIPIPGASAFMAHLSVSGLVGSSYCFRGFLPRTNKALEEEIKMVSNINKIAPMLFFWFESPKRVLESIKKIKEILPHAPLSVMKEITKIHEKIFFGTALDVYEKIENEIRTQGEKGEWSIALQCPLENKHHQKSEEEPSLLWEIALKILIESGISVSEATKRISQHLPISKKLVYERALRIAEKKT